MQLITLSGVDGSGKSTQLSLIKEKLEQAGKKVFYFHAIEFSLANRLARRFKGEKGFVPGAEKASMKATWSSLQLRKIFLFIDIIRFKSLMRKLAKEKYDYVVSDRYFYDSIINILYLAGQHNLFASPSSIWLERFIPRPDYPFYFQITAEEIMCRDRIPEQGIKYLKDKIALFEQKKKHLRLLTINASASELLISDTLSAYL